MDDTTSSEPLPQPEVRIDNLADPLATVVEIKFGDFLGELLDTVQALKNLGLNISRASIADGLANRFYVTDAETNEKVFSSDRLEEIRAVIIRNLMSYHPEAIQKLSPSFVGSKTRNTSDSPLGPRKQPSVRTKIAVTKIESGATRSAVHIETLDRPALLVDIIKIVKDLSIQVISAEINTVGDVADDTIYCTYRGQALNSSMEQLVVNVLQYYLSMAEIEESY